MALLTSGAVPASTNAAYVATERLYLDKDGNVCREGDPDRVELLVGENGVLPRERAAELGLVSDTPAEAPPATTPVTAQPVVTPPGPPKP